jgi:hypothetical protein
MSLERELQRLGLRVRKDWLAGCSAHLQATCGPFQAASLDKQVRAPCCLLRRPITWAVDHARRAPAGHVCKGAGLTAPTTPCRLTPVSAHQVQLVYAQFLEADLNCAGAGSLPDVAVRSAYDSGAQDRH